MAPRRPRPCWRRRSASRRSPGSSPSGRASILARVTGTGRAARIIQRDIEAFVAVGVAGGRRRPPPRRPCPPAGDGAADRAGPGDRGRRAEPDPRGDRAADGAVQGAGAALLHHDRDRDGAARPRSARAPGAARAPKVTFTDVVVRACAVTRSEAPRRQRELHRHRDPAAPGRATSGIAVAVDGRPHHAGPPGLRPEVARSRSPRRRGT